MSETSTMFLTLIPSMGQPNIGKYESSPIDHVTLNLAVESLSYHFVSGDKLGPLANGFKAGSLEDGNTVSHGTNTPTEQTRTEPPPTDEKPTDQVSVPSPIETIDEPILPPTLNHKQDLATDKRDKIVDKLETQVSNLSTQFLTPATALKHRLQNSKDLIVCPGVYDGFSARIALSVGFDALYMVRSLPSRYVCPNYSRRSDRCRHYSLTTRPARSRPRTAQRYAGSCRHDRQPRSVWHPGYSGHGYRLWGLVFTATLTSLLLTRSRPQYDNPCSPAVHSSQRRRLPHRRSSPHQTMRSSFRQESSQQRHLSIPHPCRPGRDRQSSLRHRPHRPHGRPPTARLRRMRRPLTRRPRARRRRRPARRLQEQRASRPGGQGIRTLASAPQRCRERPQPVDHRRRSARDGIPNHHLLVRGFGARLRRHQGGLREVEDGRRDGDPGDRS